MRSGVRQATTGSRAAVLPALFDQINRIDLRARYVAQMSVPDGSSYFRVGKGGLPPPPSTGEQVKTGKRVTGPIIRSQLLAQAMNAW